MNILKAIRAQLAVDVGVTVIRADQTGDVPAPPYATYKLISDRKGTGRENVTHIDSEDQLIEERNQERQTTISFTVYGTSHDNAFEVAKQLRKWFESRGFFFLEDMNVGIVQVSDVRNRSVFLIDSYDEKYGFDAMIRYIESDETAVDYFDKVESEIIIDRE
ncbi:LIC_12616 family protein [Solibacillus isronensis]|uniref:phage neck terminator protein n=1 Tax=Solibacillus isronensis TaxID=412383 RepID=UPI00399F1B53